MTNANAIDQPLQIWLTDRSRIEAGTDHCQMSRYFGYHHLGYGITLAKPSLDPWIGIAVHDLLARAVDARTTMPADDIPKVIQAGMKLWVPRLETICKKRQETEHTIRETQWFTRILALGWWTMLGEWLFVNFEIVSIEEELHLDLDDGRIRLMSRPDLLLRTRKDNKLNLEPNRLCILDWKTMSGFDAETTSRTYAESVQMALLTAVVEAKYEEPVETYWIAGLVKGGKKKFEKDGMTTPERRFFSSLCYAMTPQAPFNDWSTKGYWYKKAPVWEHMDAEAWIGVLRSRDKKGDLRFNVLHESFPIMGPFRRQTNMIPQVLRQIVGTENRMIEALWKLAEAEDPTLALDGFFDRAYGNCTSFYGDVCPFMTMCYSLPGHEDPIGSGLYQIRRPHHEPELQAQIESGITPAPEAWEPTEQK